MNEIDWKSWWMLAASVYGAVLGIVVWLRKPGEEAGAAVTKLREELTRQISTLGDRMSSEVADLRRVQDTLGERVEHLPDADDLRNVSGDVRELKAKVEGLVNTQSGQTMALGRIENYLLNRSHK